MRLPAQIVGHAFVVTRNGSKKVRMAAAVAHQRNMKRAYSCMIVIAPGTCSGRAWGREDHGPCEVQSWARCSGRRQLAAHLRNRPLGKVDGYFLAMRRVTTLKPSETEPTATP